MSPPADAPTVMSRPLAPNPACLRECLQNPLTLLGHRGARRARRARAHSRPVPGAGGRPSRDRLQNALVLRGVAQLARFHQNERIPAALAPEMYEPAGDGHDVSGRMLVRAAGLEALLMRQDDGRQQHRDGHNPNE